jgi:hypothetical protein
MGEDVQMQVFLTSALVGGLWSASRPGPFTLGERTSGTHFIGGWVDPRTGLDDVERREILLYRASNSNPSAVQLVASRYTDCAIPVQKIPVRNNLFSMIMIMIMMMVYIIIIIISLLLLILLLHCFCVLFVCVFSFLYSS